MIIIVYVFPFNLIISRRLFLIRTVEIRGTISDDGTNSTRYDEHGFGVVKRKRKVTNKSTAVIRTLMRVFPRPISGEKEYKLSNDEIS